MGLRQWTAQSIASMSGTGIVGRGAWAAAKKSDRALRNISADVWSKVAAEIDSDARQGRYFGCYAVPRSALTNTGGIGGGLARGLERRHFIYYYKLRAEAGEQLYADIAVFWGQKSTKLRTNNSFKMYAMDLLTIYLAECIAHGFDSFAGRDSELGNLQKMANISANEAAVEFFCHNIIKMVALYAYKDGIKCHMNFHVPTINTPEKLGEQICKIITELYEGRLGNNAKTIPSAIDNSKEVDLESKTSIAEELKRFKKEYTSRSDSEYLLDAVRTTFAMQRGEA